MEVINKTNKTAVESITGVVTSASAAENLARKDDNYCLELIYDGTVFSGSLKAVFHEANLAFVELDNVESFLNSTGCSKITIDTDYEKMMEKTQILSVSYIIFIISLTYVNCVKLCFILILRVYM